MGLRDIPLKYIPTTIGCVSWSRDGELAIADSESFNILIPRLQLSAKPSKDSPDSLQWDTIRVNTTPLQTATTQANGPPWHVFSIGEEQPSCTISALAWSPPGIAKYRRSVLAVLTTNHFLTLYESTSNPRSLSSWKSALVINIPLRSYFEHLKETTTENFIAQLDLLKLRSRIRSFSWSQPSVSASIWGTCFIALANDANEVVFAHISSSHEGAPNPGGIWKAKILGHVRVSPLRLSLPGPSLVKSKHEMPLCRYIRNMSWSPWVSGPNSSEVAFLSCVLQNHIIHVKVAKNTTLAEPSCGPSLQLSLKTDEEWLDIDAKHGAYWYEEALGKKLVLFIIGNRGISVLPVSTNSLALQTSLIIPPPSQANPLIDDSLKGNLFHETWAPIVGKTMEIIGQTLRLKVLSHISELSVAEFSLEDFRSRAYQVSSDQLDIEPADTWERQVSFYKSNYSIRHHLEGHVLARIWGLGVSLGGKTAVCFSLHPTDQLEYTANSSDQATIIFGESAFQPDAWTKSEESKSQHLNPTSSSVEAFLLNFTFEDFQEIALENGLWSIPSKSHKTKQEKLVDQYLKPLEDFISCSKIPLLLTSFPENVEYEATIAFFSRSVIYNPLLSAVRFRHALSIFPMSSLLEPKEHPSLAIDPNSSALEPEQDSSFEVETLCRLVTTILQMPRKYIQKSLFSKKILYLMACVGAFGLYSIGNILDLSRESFDWLSKKDGLDMTDELKRISGRLYLSFISSSALEIWSLMSRYIDGSLGAMLSGYPDLEAATGVFELPAETKEPNGITSEISESPLSSISRRGYPQYKSPLRRNPPSHTRPKRSILEEISTAQAYPLSPSLRPKRSILEGISTAQARPLSPTLRPKPLRTRIPIQLRIDTRQRANSTIPKTHPLPETRDKNTIIFPIAPSKDVTLTLCLYGNNGYVARTARLTIPAKNQFNPGAGSPTIKRLFNGLDFDFDDEKLCQQIRFKYDKMKGPLRSWLSLRTLHRIELVSHPRSKSLSHSAEKGGQAKKPLPPEPPKVVRGKSYQSLLWECYRSPKIGRGRFDWVDRVHRLSAIAELSGNGPDRTVLKMIEGWSASRIAGACAFVYVLSIVLGVLWIILGVNGDSSNQTNRTVWQSAGERVETGAVLSGLFLLLGWSGVILWALFSWLAI
ncbi:MAG: hypothetical protein M1829_002163 [Trizodia sp. TS-e1964]|nr:MAG: hypothetical protein M1829_002163 [Trizodia sp. TS-e1964]